MCKLAAPLALAAALVACALPAVAAANTVTIGTIPTTSFSLTLNGVDQSATYAVSIPISYTSSANNKNATNGWHVTATSTTLTGTSTGRKLATTASTVTAFTDDAGCTLTNCTNAVITTTYPIALPAGATPPTAVTVASAQPGSGIGGNTETMQVSVAIPANTYADVYTSTLTLSAIEGP
jgi:hypothetical protein